MRLRSRAAWLLLVLSGLVVASAPGAGQSRRTTATFWDGLRFRTPGPAVFAGRVDDVAVSEANPAIIYAGTTTGGLWKTVNNGTTWEVLFNTLDDVISIGDVTIAQDNPDIVWVGTGGSFSWGRGAYKSIDGGKSWQNMGLADSKHINRIVLDPRNHDVVYVAVTGHQYGPSRERGLFKSVDGGKSWEHVLFVNEYTGVHEVVLDPGAPDTVYATTYQRARTAYGNRSGGPESAIRKSIDGGRTWRRLDNGLPAGDRGAIGLDVFLKNPRILYALVEHENGKDVFRTDDAGESWRKMNEPAGPKYQGHRPNWFDQVHIDPSDDQRIYVLGVNLFTSTDGGRSFDINESAVQSGLWPPSNGLYLFNTSTHSDHRGFWVNPRNPNLLVSGNDGGVCISYEKGRTWDCMNNMDLAQVYHVGYDMDVPYRIFFGTHDNLGWGGPSAARSYLGVGAGEWFLVAGGDGFVATADPSDARTIYAESQNGNMSRVDRVTNERVPIRPEPAEGEEPYRWNFNTPMMISPHDSSTLLMAANRLFRSTDRGQSWTVVSPDVTANIKDPSLPIMGAPMKDSRMGARVPTWGTIFTFTESPRKAGVYYTGADDGTVQVSRDGGATWTAVSDRFPGLPARTWVSKLAASRVADGRAYASFAGHRNGDYRPHLYVTEDFGATWRAIGAGLPDGQVVHVITEDQRNGDVLYAGTEFGVFVSIDRGESWTRLRAGLPTVPVYSIVMHPRENDLIVGTFGRGVWILDDATPIQQAAEAAAAKTAYLFDQRPARQFNPAHDKWWMWGDRRFWGENPPRGAGLGVYLQSAPRDIAIAIRDERRQVVRTLRREELGTLQPGRINRIYWNLRYDPLPAPPSQRLPAGVRPYFTGDQKRAHSYREIDRDALDPLSAPFVPAGIYSVTLSVDGREVDTKPLTIEADPLVRISEADRRTWHDVSREVHELQRVAYEAGDRFATLAGQVSALTKAASGQQLPAEVSGQVEALGKRMATLRLRLALPVPGGLGGDAGLRITNVPGQLAQLKSQLIGATALPTEVQKRRLVESRAGLIEATNEANEILSKDLPAVIAALQQNRVTVPSMERLPPFPGVSR